MGFYIKERQNNVIYLINWWKTIDKRVKADNWTAILAGYI